MKVMPRKLICRSKTGRISFVDYQTFTVWTDEQTLHIMSDNVAGWQIAESRLGWSVWFRALPELVYVGSDRVPCYKVEVREVTTEADKNGVLFGGLGAPIDGKWFVRQDAIA